MSMQLEFTKMHGLGNDFVVLDATRRLISLEPAQLRFIADRHFGVGCDQILMVEAPPTPEVDFRYRIFNADGGEVEQCGNGARCFARFVHERGLTTKQEISVQTLSGVIRLYLEADDRVRVNMGVPCFAPAEIPLEAEAEADRYVLSAGGREFTLGSVSMGNPHAVLQVEDVDHAPVAETGALLERHSAFPRRANIGFMQIIDSTHIRLRVFERGSGETLACGTGACAAAVVGQRWGVLEESVEVALPGGEVDISWAGASRPVWMSGPAVTVYEGKMTL